jgi:hypothetical protein
VFDRLAQARNRENGPVDSECTFQPKLQSSRETREAVVQYVAHFFVFCLPCSLRVVL